jgi:predicted PurR-regulated permease PerM
MQEKGSLFAAKYRNLAFIAVAALALYAAFWMLLPFVPAILWAAVLAVLMTPIHRRVRKKFEGVSPNIPATITTILTLLIVGVPLTLIGVALASQVQSFASDLRNAAPAGQSGLSLDSLVAELNAALQPILKPIAPNFDLTQWFQEHKENILQNVSAPAGKLVVAVGYALFTLVIAFLTMFFVVRDAEKLREPALDLIPLPRESGEKILSRLSDTIRAVFVGIVLVAIIQGTIAGITYYAVGIPHALLWGVATIVLCTIPLLGAPILYIPMGLILMSQGKYTEAAVLLGVGFLIVSQIDNLLRPFIIGARIELHPMAVFFSLLGGIFLMGPVGIMGGPMVLIVLLSLMDVVRERMRLARESQGESPAAEPT